MELELSSVGDPGPLPEVPPADGLLQVLGVQRSEWDGWKQIFERLWWMLRPTPPHCHQCYGPRPKIGDACMDCVHEAVVRHIARGETRNVIYWGY